jgi:ribonuclease P protein subunit POP4
LKAAFAKTDAIAQSGPIEGEQMIKGKGYCIMKGNIRGHELIGLRAKVAGGTDSSRIGIAGEVIDESKNVLVLETENGIKRIPKQEAVFEFEIGDEKEIVSGKEICYRAEDRTKAMGRKRNGRVQ